MRSDDGEKWYEHPMIATEEAVNDALGGSLEGLSTQSIASTSISSLWSEHVFCFYFDFIFIIIFPS